MCLTNMGSHSSAAARVFNITELHEKILVHLSPLDLLHVRRVARTWEENIRGSAVVQRIIYPEPITTEVAWIVDFSTDRDGPLDKHVIGVEVHDVVSMTMDDAMHYYPNAAISRSATFNELLFRRCRLPKMKSRDTAGARITRGELLTLTEQANKTLFADERSLSCDEMLLVDITLDEVEVMVSCGCLGSLSSSNCRNRLVYTRVHNKSGLRVKDIRKHIRQICPISRPESFRFPETLGNSFAFVNISKNGIVFPNEVEAHWIKQNLKLDVKWSR
ncbi:hypothetical protein AC578_2236 [Pseudocercospora eumusae]|uniref:F-box domain-containing protein n=1 Tax=Pseudocercospora eumusae TaxID=321146 RepID=A0A139GWP6_9PEZI|nr:hypothetical protein AC578_2236 [Pseudocercospora eumusae]